MNYLEKIIGNKYLPKIIMEYINFNDRFYRNELLNKTKDIKFYTSYRYHSINNACILYSKIMNEWIMISTTD